MKELIPFGPTFAIITDSNVAPLYGLPLQKALTDMGFTAHLFTLPAGEVFKTRATKERLEDQMLEKKLGRDTCLIALGGGVVTDLGGFIASTYCRGIPLVMIPTTLLAMVDASIGGKNGVNAGNAKNRIGTIYPPHKIIIDLEFLKTLPLSELKNGMIEMIKHAAILNRSYFELLEKQHDLKIAIEESRHIKLSVVEEDPYEKGKRRLLNFGHTIGHAIETASNYRISHGEAVAAGMIIESRLAMALGYLAENDFQKISNLIGSVFPSFDLPEAEKVFECLTLDKKSLLGKPRFVMINGIGSSMSFDGE